jgi:hypothetical protein
VEKLREHHQPALDKNRQSDDLMIGVDSISLNGRFCHIFARLKAMVA